MIKFIIFLFTVNFAFGQSFKLDDKFDLTIPLTQDLNVIDTSSKKGFFIRLAKNNTGTERFFLNVTIKFEITKENPIDEQEIHGCNFGNYTKIDTVDVSSYKTKRWFGENCNWTKEVEDDRIVGYSVDWVVNLNQNKYLSISSNYFSANENEKNQLKAEVLTFVKGIKIKEN
jgi:hypothetical protein